MVIKISLLKRAKYNPETRIEERKIRQLAKSVDEIGLIYPILIDKNNNVIDGHRRLAAVLLLGWTEVECIVIKTNISKERIYAEINATGLKLSGSDNLKVWVKNPNAVTKRARERFESCSEVFGKSIINLLIKNHQSIRPLGLATQICLYLGRDEDIGFKRKAARWLVRHRMTQLARSYMDTEQQPTVIEKSIIENRPLETRYI